MAVVLITGCSSGIGLATALAFARRGHRTYATMRNPSRGAALRDAIDREGLDAEVLAVDVTSDSSVRQAVDEILRRHGAVDVAVNNAGIGPFAAVERSDDEHWRSIFDTNLFGAVRVARAVLPGMRANGSGTIVNVSSIAGRTAPAPTMGAYAASKHALCALSDSIAVEGRPFGVRSYCIEPGFFATQIMVNGEVDALPADDPYASTAAAVTAHIRAGVAAAPPPDAVASLLLDAAEGRLGTAVHHPIGVDDGRAGSPQVPSPALQ